MNLPHEIILVITAYLMGSIPSAVWLGKLFYSTDVRDYGSGNAGATNTFRILGPKLGLPVLFLDVLKGFLAVKLLVFTTIPADSSNIITLQLALGTAALAGHIFPVFARFKGGKGIATLLGFMLALAPEASLVCIGIFLFILLSSKMVSLSSITAALAFPVINIFVFQQNHRIMIIFSILIALMVMVTHRKNIIRIVKNEESKVSLRTRSKNE